MVLGVSFAVCSSLAGLCLACGGVEDAEDGLFGGTVAGFGGMF